MTSRMASLVLLEVLSYSPVFLADYLFGHYNTQSEEVIIFVTINIIKIAETIDRGRCIIYCGDDGLMSPSI